MKKVLKKLLITLLIIALVCGGAYGGLMIYKKARQKPVNVYALDQFMMTNYWGDTAQTEGMVTTDKLQKIYLSDSQTVMEIYVTEGQEVKEGDPILSFDTTLSDIDLQKAEIAHQKLESSLERAQKELENIKKLQPYTLVHIVPEPLGIEYIPEITPQIISGTGTVDDPFYCLFSEEDILDQAFMEEILAAFGELQEEEPEDAEETEVSEEPEEDEEPEEGEGPEEGEEPEEDEEEPEEDEEPEPKEIYAAFVTRENDALNAPILYSWGLCLIETEEGLSFRHYEPWLSDEILDYESEPEDYYEEHGSPFTAKEIAELRNDKESEIHDIESQIKISSVELERLRTEINDGIVYAKMDGTVKNLIDPDECFMTGEPLLEISAGGGYYIEVTMGEFDLNTLQIGQEVTVDSWETGTNCTGTVFNKSEIPTTSGYSWSDGNNNVSYYPFTVFVGEENDLRENSWVSVSYSKVEENDDSWYIENFFVREEGGRKFVFVKGADGRLEKRYITTGKGLWGSYIEIKGGIEQTDMLAFPYGQDVVEGAETVDAMPEELYNFY